MSNVSDTQNVSSLCFRLFPIVSDQHDRMFPIAKSEKVSYYHPTDVNIRTATNGSNDIGS